MLAGWSLSQVSLTNTWSVLRRLKFGQIGVLLGVNALLILSFSARWWILLGTMGYRVPYLMLSMHRLAGFSVSYFTPGPQVGGEPLQVILLEKHHQIPLVPAIASIGVDRLIEIAVNLSFLMVGIILAMHSQALRSLMNTAALAPFMLLAALPMLCIILLARGQQPLSWLLQRVPDRIGGNVWFQRVVLAAGDSERQATAVFRDKPAGVLAALGVSLLSWLAIIGEYWLVLHYIGVVLPPVNVIILLVASRLAFLAPLPSGLGALEASQVFAFEALGLGPAAGLSVSLLIRGRDILFGLIGLWWAGLEWAKYER